MYLERLGFRWIGRVLNISYGTVYQWIKTWGEQVELPRAEGVVEIVRLDEMHTYVHEKKTTNGFGLLLIDLENGLSILSVEQEEQKREVNYGEK